jgi:hypothetical protein
MQAFCHFAVCHSQALQAVKVARHAWQVIRGEVNDSA